MSARNPDRERRFLGAVADGNSDFVSRVETRLQAGEEEYGDSWAWIGLRKHFLELMEEAVDLAGWAVLCDQALDSEPLDELSRRRVSRALQLVAHRGAEAFAELSQTLQIIEAALGERTAS